MDFKLKLIDPDHQRDHGNILAEDRHTYKTVEVEILDPSINNCVNLRKLDDGFISINTDAGHINKCDVKRLLQGNDTIKIKLTDGVKMDDEFAMLGGKVTLWNKGSEINLGLNGSELSNIRIKITEDCNKQKDACGQDTEAFQDNYKLGIAVKSLFGDKIGGINPSFWFFHWEKLNYGYKSDYGRSASPKEIENNAHYFKVLPCSKEEPYYKLALCDENGNLVTFKYVSKCNIIGGQNIELKDYFREDGLPSFIIKPSESKELGESYGNKSRAEVYEYNPTSHDIGSQVGKLNATHITKLQKGGPFIIENYLLNGSEALFKTDRSAPITIKEKEDGLYYVNHKFFQGNNRADAATEKLLLDDLLCLFDQDALQNGIQIIG